jgi:ABC-type transport system involved in multi-copper enzyme maturation permease subunit
LLIGPVFAREVAIAPRRIRNFVARASYVAGLLGVACTAWLVLTGTQSMRTVGDMARFGAILFQILAPLQLGLALFFSALLAASAVAQEKDRRTLILLLLTNLSNSELVLGSLAASLLNVLVLLTAALPLFMFSLLFGGVALEQIGRVFAVTLATVLVCGSLGSTLALWREKTFQALAMTVLVLVLWLVVWEIVALGTSGDGWLGLSSRDWAVAMSPWQAILEATRPSLAVDPALGWLGTPVHLFVLVAAAIAALLNGLAVAMVRVWNPPREAQPVVAEDEPGQPESIWGAEFDLAQSDGAVEGASAGRVHSAGGKTRTRPVWDNPVIWREMRTWAYGRKILVIRAAYLVLFAVAAASLYGMLHVGGPVTRADAATALVPLFLLSLILVNAQAVTSLTSERDTRALDLLLVTDLTPKEIVFGKLGGVFYNTGLMVALPMLLCGTLWLAGLLSLENSLYLVGGLAVLYAFAAVLGIHAGMIYANSRSAIGASLGTVFFLFVGVATCMRIMVAFSGSFQAQLQPFLAFMGGGTLGLYLVLGARNPSPAIGLASLVCPFATFYAITSFLLDYTLGVFLVLAGAYGFATAAMLVPAIYEFDVATGRTTIGEE